jgi:hypothetical protein
MKSRQPPACCFFFPHFGLHASLRLVGKEKARHSAGFSSLSDRARIRTWDRLLGSLFGSKLTERKNHPIFLTVNILYII